MTDRIWEPLAEIELNPSGSENAGIYCLCSRALIRCKINTDNWEELLKEKLEQFEMVEEPEILVCDPEGRPVEAQGRNLKKQEAEAVSCYCSASHYSTDDYESVMMSASDYQSTSKDQLLPCPLQNSDSGADLSENFIEKPCCRVSDNLELLYQFSKSRLETAWEKFWSENGESIIWKSWIEKYGAYINPNYLEQNSFCENFDIEINDVNKEENVNDNEMNEAITKDESVEVNEINHSNSVKREEETINVTEEKIPVLKISSYPSCGNLSEAGDVVQTNKYIDEFDVEDQILKSNSFGSYASYERGKYIGSEDDRLKNTDRERVRSRCSNTNLSVKSVANTTVTTDSMTNVTKITLSSLDLSCECESVKSSSLLSTSSDDSSGLSSTSSSSSKEEICTEADMWWRKVWKEHYEDQYALSYQKFAENFDDNGGTKSSDCIQSAKDPEQCMNKGEGECRDGTTLEKANAFQSWKRLGVQSFDSASLGTEQDTRNESDDQVEYTSKGTNVIKGLRTVGRIDEFKRQLENSDDSCDDVEEIDSKWRKKITPKRSQKPGRSPQKKEKLVRKMDNIKQAMALMGFSFKADSPDIQSGYVTYRKKNIRGQSRRLRLCDGKPRSHLFFDDDGIPFEATPKEFADTQLPFSDSCEKPKDDVTKVEENYVEPESLGYEAHSSSIEGGDDVVDENKKQKKKRKRQRKYSLPQEILDNKRLFKYWMRRYQLFSKFDSGIKLDAESWYSVTPEQLAKHHAERCRCDVVVDAFCGAGGNSIQFAFTCERVIAVDIDPLKIEMARCNARIYGVEDRIEFIVGDFVKLASNLHADVVFLSPPWGGPSYVSHDAYSLENILPPLGGEGLFRLASGVADNVAFFLPKNTNSTEVALLCGPGGSVEIEQNFMDRRLSSVTAYFGELVMDPEDPYL